MGGTPSYHPSFNGIFSLINYHPLVVVPPAMETPKSALLPSHSAQTPCTGAQARRARGAHHDDLSEPFGNMTNNRNLMGFNEILWGCNGDIMGFKPSYDCTRPLSSVQLNK